LRGQIEHKKSQDRELFVDPAFFKDLPGTRVDLFLQQGKYKNEMSLFRYNAILTPVHPCLPLKADHLLHLASRPSDSREQELSLKNYLREKLPEYMVPSRIAFLDHIPLSLNGKVAKRLLPPPPTKKTAPHRPALTLCPPLEQAIIETWMDVLNLPQINKLDDFFELGGHSLSAAQVVLKLSDRLGKEIPLRLLFQFPTVEGFARSIESQQDINRRSVTWAKMLQDSFLPAAIVGTPLPSYQREQIFLTGATGFLGAYMLKDLLCYTTARIYCLVRGNDYEEGVLRLRKNLAYYRILDEIDFSRVIVVLGELSRERFGLNDEQYTFYTQEMDSIYHCAAQVNFADSYETLRPSNVLGAIEILRLAVTNRSKSVHYISTLHVLTQQDQGSSERLTESHYPSHGDSLQMGYLQSKWVAERLMLTAKERNIPVNIYRVGRLGGDLQSGACQKSDFYWGLVRACVKMGKIPATGFEEQILPVDIASKAIIRLSTQSDGEGRTFHILNPTPLSAETLISCIREKGYLLSPCTLGEWNQTILDYLKSDPNDPATALAGFLSNRWGEKDPSFSADVTLEEMRKLGISIPDISPDWIRKTIDFFRETHFFPKR
jgi:thioester reductase-like protein